MLQIYLDPCTINCRKVLAGLDLLETPFKLHFIDYFAGGQKDPEFTKINPFATVPAATDDDLTLTESNAILQYAGDLGGKDEAAYPRDLKKRANINRWLLWETSSWFPSCYTYIVEFVVKPLMKAEPDQAVIDAEAPRWNQLATVLDNQLSKTKYICGPEVTLADIAIASPMHLPEAMKLPLDKYPHLKRWYGDIQKLPCWQKTQGAVDEKLLPSKPENAGKQVRSTLNYTKALSDQLTELYFYEDADGKERDIHEPGDDAQEVVITDGWHMADEFDHDKHGFSLKKHETSYAGAWDDDTSVKEQFYPEIVEFLKRTLGAKRVLVFDHTIRTAKNAAKKLTQENNTTQRAPVRLVHCDYTSESGPVRVRQLLGEEADDLLSRRVAFVNVWKPLAKVEEMPLAMCDVTSSPPEDFFKLYLRYRDRVGENYVMKHSTTHKWWYFPQMTAEQVILLKTYDSDEQRARFVGHTAFQDPDSAPDAPLRESIEIRTIAFF